MEFKSFGKIEHIKKLWMSITQKIHGSNAQVCIFEENGFIQLRCGSRNRWLTIEDDNYGFANFVESHRQEFIDKLGLGTHYGEWAGPGINSGEGLKDKCFLLFNWERWVGKELPPQTLTVPLLYKGKISLDKITECMDSLKTNGSMLVPGFMKPEGIVIKIGDKFYKNVFDEEETHWKESTKIIGERPNLMDVSYLLQPIRLQKILSRDEKFLREYPSSLREICQLYAQDLEQEKQFKSQTEEELIVEKKSLGKNIFYFVKCYISGIEKPGIS